MVYELKPLYYERNKTKNIKKNTQDDGRQGRVAVVDAVHLKYGT